MKKIKPNLKTYCISHEYISNLDKLNLNIIGSGAFKKKFPNHWLTDAKGKKNISKKNFNYGTLTSIYWIWKNDINNLNSNDFIGICHYRRFWLKKKHDKNINLKNLNKNILLKIPNSFKKFDGFVCKPQNLKGYKLSKLLKKGKRNLLKDPTIFFDKNKHTINLHFDMFHIQDGLKNAIKFLNNEDREDFLNYVKSKTEFYPLSIFILKKKFFSKLCLSTFNWLQRCEKLFDKNKLKGYGQIRIFDFLAERYFSFWISKYCNYKIWPYCLIDIRKK